MRGDLARMTLVTSARPQGGVDMRWKLKYKVEQEGDRGGNEVELAANDARNFQHVPKQGWT